jgi:S-(hydroxymethyl)glutathione dehydrogenase/alcohol dehydrogenase
MKAAVVHDKKELIRIEDLDLRSVKNHEVRVRVVACGVCHSDLSVLNEYFACPTPVVLGHEAAGIVEEVGPEVTGIEIGDHVVASWSPACGTCRYCRSGKRHLCHLCNDPTSAAAGRLSLEGQPVAQFLGVGGFAEQAILSDNAVVKIDPAMPLDKACLLGCAVLTGFGAVTEAARVATGDEVAVFGCGGVGLNIVQAAADAGARLLIAVDLDDRKLELASRFGATHTFRGDDPELAKQIRALTEERQGVDHAFEVVGDPELARICYQCICKGGEVVLVGIARATDKLSLSQIVAVTQEKTVRGSQQGSVDAWVVVPKLVSRYLAGELRVDELVTRSYPLKEINKAFADLRAGRNARGIVRID